MRKLIVILLLAAMMYPARGQEADSLRFATLDGKLEEYFAALEKESIPVKIREADFLVSSSDSGLVRNHVAIKIYRHFIESPLMGDEAVAVHLADEWFTPGRTVFADEIDLLNAKIYAEFNRRSLLGCRAPSLLMENPEGEALEIFGLADSAYAAPSDRYRVLFFYSPTCATCKVEAPVLADLLESKNYPLDFYAVMTGTDRAAWDGWRAAFAPNVSATRVFHYWDPDVSSDYERKYGLLQTPRLFLIDPSGTIIGRGLDPVALAALLQDIYETQLTYGSEESSKFYDNVFGSIGEGLTAGDVKAVADHIAVSAASDLRLRKQMTGDLLYWLVGKSGGAYKDGAKYVIDSLILSHPDIWSTRADTVQVVTMASIMNSMLSLSPVGKKVPDLEVSGVLRRWNKSSEGRYRLGGIGAKYTYIFIYSVSCPHCEEELDGISALLGAARTSTDRKVKRAAKNTAVLLVDLDRLMEEEPDMAYALLDSFDLASLPYATLLDRDGTVLQKYISFIAN